MLHSASSSLSLGVSRWIPGEWDKGREGGGAGVSRWIPGEWDKGSEGVVDGYPGCGTRGGRGWHVDTRGMGQGEGEGGRLIPGEWDMVREGGRSF